VAPKPDLNAALTALMDPGNVSAAVGSILLSPTAVEALKVGQEWENGKATPAAGPDGRVLYRFGAGLPTIVCAPLRVCTMELQAGERIQGDAQIGDAIHWDMSLSTFGGGDEATSIIVLKPQQSGLDTTLLITTNRRAYYVRLISQPDAYLARVAFSYPQDEAVKWREDLAEQSAKLKQATYNAPAADNPAPSLENLHFNYSCKGSNASLRPLRVFDDGAKTYIQMPAAIQNREVPVLVVIGPDKKSDVVNYRVKEQTYIVDRLFDRAQLKLGAGKHAQKVEITHDTNNAKG
jgi:type IV secretion system protein VirB9